MVIFDLRTNIKAVQAPLLYNVFCGLTSFHPTSSVIG